MESLNNVTHNVTVPNPAIQSGVCVSLFVSVLFGPASFDSGVLLAPIRNPVLPLLTTPHSPLPITTPPALRRLSLALHSRYPQANIASSIPNHNTSLHVFFQSSPPLHPILVIAINGL